MTSKSVQSLQSQLRDRADQIASKLGDLRHLDELRGQGKLVRPSPAEDFGFWEAVGQSRLIDVPPGIGKTFITTHLVNNLWEQHGISSLVLTLSHDVMDAVEGREDWNHWIGRKSRGCKRSGELNAYWSKGYPAAKCEDCNCGYYEQFSKPGPTIAPVNFLGAIEPKFLGLQARRLSQVDWEKQTYWQDLDFYHPEILDFKLRVIDEFNPSTFVESEDIPLSELKKLQDLAKGEHHADILDAICDLLSASAGTLVPLDYASLNTALESRGLSVKNLWYSRLDLPLFQSGVGRKNIESAPNNRLPTLLPILCWEAEAIRLKRPYNPRVFIKDQTLHVRYRKPYIEAGPTLFLDASVEPNLMKKAFNMDLDTEINKIDYGLETPSSVEVYQWGDSSDFSRTSLDLSPYDKGVDARAKKYSKLADDLEDIPLTASIGVITFRSIEGELVEHVCSLGFENVLSAHYGNVRSFNEMEHVDVLVLFGTSRGNADDMKLSAQAMFFDEPPLDTSYDPSLIETVETNYGAVVDLKSGGYTNDERMQAVHRQASSWEMYQAFHRARPLRRSDQTPLKVFIYSTMPIPGVKLSGFLGRRGKIANVLRKELEDSGALKRTRLARITQSPNAKLDSHQTFIRRADVTERIAELAGATWNVKAKSFEFKKRTN